MRRSQRSEVRSQRSEGAKPQAARGGTTLVEVLMAILAMGIGVVSLATLFPISVLRTARANQLTNATIVFHNARGLIATYPHLVHDPDNDARYYTSSPTEANVQEHYDEDANQNGRLDPMEDFPPGMGNGRLDRGISIVDPLGWYSHAELGNGLEGTLGNDGGNPPLADVNRGWPRHNGAGNGFLLTQSNQNPGIAFITGTTSTERKRSAARWFVLPDSWQDVVTATVTGVQTNASQQVIGVDLDVPAGALSDVQPLGAQYRITLFESSASSRRPGSVTREVTQASGTSVFWSEDVNPRNNMLDPGEDLNGNGVLDIAALPAGFVPERARLEVQEWRYSWLLTVRKGVWSGSLSNEDYYEADVVVVFRRSFREEDERIYASRFERGTPTNGLVGWDGAPGEAGVDDDLDGPPNGPPANVDEPDETGWVGTDDNRTGYVFWDSSGGEPALKRGGFVFETGAGHWYRVQDFRIEVNPGDDPQLPAGTDTRATLLLDRDIVTDASRDPERGAIVMPNVIEVFRLSTDSRPPLPALNPPTRVR